MTIDIHIVVFVFHPLQHAVYDNESTTTTHTYVYVCVYVHVYAYDVCWEWGGGLALNSCTLGQVNHNPGVP